MVLEQLDILLKKIGSQFIPLITNSIWLKDRIFLKNCNIRKIIGN